MPLIGSGLLDDVNHTAGRMAVLRREGRRQNLHFLCRILNRFDGSGPTHLVVTHDAILEDTDGPVALAG